MDEHSTSVIADRVRRRVDDLLRSVEEFRSKPLAEQHSEVEQFSAVVLEELRWIQVDLTQLPEPKRNQLIDRIIRGLQAARLIGTTAEQIIDVLVGKG